MINKKSKILVLGGSGQVGSSLTNLLSENNYDFSLVRKGKWGNDSLIKKAKLISTDLFDLNEKGIKKLIHKYDVIFHLAANTQVQNNLKIENKNFIDQVGLLNKLLLSMIGTKKVLVFSSSCSVYAGSNDKVIDQYSSAMPLTSYDLVKSTSDKIIEYYKNTHNVKCSSVRFSNIYGPDQNLEKKKNRRILNTLLSQMHSNGAVEIVGNGKFYRNYIHVNDACRMLVKIAKNINTKQAIFLGCSKENIFFIDAIKILSKIYNKTFDANVKIKTGRKFKYRSDTRSYKIMPSEIFLSNFRYEFNIEKGFNNLLENTEF